VRSSAIAPFEIETSPRIGITKSVDLELRYSIRVNAFVSQNKGTKWRMKSG
jgi:3-methyladenine DNA glycosylase Mpg